MSNYSQLSEPVLRRPVETKSIFFARELDPRRR
jgi:hypothetical protein